MTFKDYIKEENLSKDITTLRIVGRGLLNLYGIEKFKNLDIVILPINGIKDLRPLSELTKIQFLNISSNFIENIEPLKNLTNLIELNISANYIKDISPIISLNNLNNLYTSDNYLPLNKQGFYRSHIEIYKMLLSIRRKNKIDKLLNNV